MVTTQPVPLQVRVRGELVTLTPETIIATRRWYAENARACIAEAREYVASSGTRGTRVNNLESYIAWREASAEASMRGEGDHSFAFVQRAVALQTGDCVPLLA